MTTTSITIPVRIDTAVFRRFAVFDTLKRQKRWKSPALFAGILLAFALVCFAMNQKADQAVFIGSLLMIIALGLPAVYFGMFFRSLDAQAKAMKLHTDRLSYTVVLTEANDGIQVTPAKEGNGQKTVSFDWDKVFGAFRDTGCIYLYVSNQQAFLLPDEQADVSADVLWEFLKARLPKSCLRDCRKS